MRTEAMLKTAAQTNQWYSTLIFNAQPEPIYAHPLTVRPTAAGFEVALPAKEVMPTERRDVEIHYAHKNPIVISPVAFEPGPAKLARASDWAIDISMARGSDDMRVTVAHGSPYASFRLSARRRAPEAARRRRAHRQRRRPARAGAAASAASAMPLFGPTGVRWERCRRHRMAGPAARRQGLFRRRRPARRPSRPRCNCWRATPTPSCRTRGSTGASTPRRARSRRPSRSSHARRWKAPTTARCSACTRTSGTTTPRWPASWARPTTACAARSGCWPAPSSRPSARYPGFVPHWPGVGESPRAKELADLLKTDVRKRRTLMPDKENRDNWRTSAYWQGKGLTRLTQLAAVAEQQGDLAARDQLLALVKERMEFWFSGEGSQQLLPLRQGARHDGDLPRRVLRRRADERPPLPLRLLDPRRRRDRAARPGLGDQGPLGRAWSTCW